MEAESENLLWNQRGGLRAHTAKLPRRVWVAIVCASGMVIIVIIMIGGFRAHDAGPGERLPNLGISSSPTACASSGIMRLANTRSDPAKNLPGNGYKPYAFDSDLALR